MILLQSLQNLTKELQYLIQFHRQTPKSWEISHVNSNNAADINSD